MWMEWMIFLISLFGCRFFCWIYVCLFFGWFTRCVVRYCVCVCVCFESWTWEKKRKPLKYIFILDLIWINENGFINILVFINIIVCNQAMNVSFNQPVDTVFSFIFVQMKPTKSKIEWISTKNFIAFTFRSNDFVFFL